MAEQHQEDVNEEGDEGSMEAVVVPLLEPEEETIALAGLIPQDIMRIRSTDPFLYHSIVNEITGNNVCNFERIRDNGDAAAGGADEFAFLGLSRSRGLTELRIVSASNVDRRLCNIIESTRPNSTQNIADDSLSAPGRLTEWRDRDDNKETNDGVEVGQPPNTIVIQRNARGAVRGLRRSRSLPQLSNIRVRVAGRTVTRRRRFSTEVCTPDLSNFMPPDVIAGNNHAEDGGGDSLLDELLANIPTNFDDEVESSTN